MTYINLTPKLLLTHIEENNVQDDKLIAVCCFFSFYNEECTAYITIDSLDSEEPSFALIESCSDLHDSFTNQIESQWSSIVKAVRNFHEIWMADESDLNYCSSCNQEYINHINTTECPHCKIPVE